MTIEGIPDGWELVRIGTPEHGEVIMLTDGSIEQHHEGRNVRMNKNYVIIRKIEKPKQFRPFANAAEFEPFRDRWVRYLGDDCGGSRVSFYDNTHARIDDDVDNWNAHFKDYTFDDGTPFGIEVTE